MDQRRFDAVARSLAAPRTRRGLLGSLAALVVGVRAGAAQDGCPPGQTKNKKGQCNCPAGTTPCPDGCYNTKNNPSNCGACGNACLPGQICQKGECRCPGGAKPDRVNGCGAASTTTTTLPPCPEPGPESSYTLFCAVTYDCQAGVATLTGTCRNILGSDIDTSITVNDCAAQNYEIENCNGVLTCGECVIPPCVNLSEPCTRGVSECCSGYCAEDGYCREYEIGP